MPRCLPCLRRGERFYQIFQQRISLCRVERPALRLGKRGHQSSRFAFAKSMFPVGGVHGMPQCMEIGDERRAARGMAYSARGGV